MMKKFKILMTALCMCCGMFVIMNVSAEEVHVYDHAGLLSVQEEEYLENLAAECAEQWNMNFLVVTTDDAEGKSAMEYADDFYDEQFPENSEKDGILYLIDMDNREIYLSTSGLAIRYLTDDRVDYILDEAFGYVANGDYYGTFVTFMEETERYMIDGIPEDQYNYDVNTGEIDYYHDTIHITFGELIFAFTIALTSSILTILGIKAKYQLKFEDFQYNAYTDSLANLNIKSDQLINNYTTHHRISRSSSYSGGGSSFGGSRSSTHRSSSGRSHGGGGRKF